MTSPGNGGQRTGPPGGDARTRRRAGGAAWCPPGAGGGGAGPVGGAGRGGGGRWARVMVTPGLSVLDHAPDRLLGMFRAAGGSGAGKVGLSPPVRLALPGTTVTVATGA